MNDATLMAADYEDSLAFMQQLAGQFGRRYHVHVDDLCSEANELFIRAWQCPKAAERDWFAHLRRWLWYGWLDKFRPEFSRNSRRDWGADLGTVHASEGHVAFELTELAERMSEDALVVCQLVFHTPVDVWEPAEARGGTPRNYKSCIRAHLRQLGWPPARIGAAFDEIKQLA